METFVRLSYLALTICLFNLVSVQGEGRHHPHLRIKRTVSTEDQNADYWKHIAELEIEATKKVLNAINTNTAKNIIIFVGDGMSLPTLTASRIYKAQYEARKKGQTANGEESLLTFEKFPHVGLSKTYCIDAQTSDSAATASAMFTGVKTNYLTLGFDNTVKTSNVSSEATATKVESILTWAQKAGKDTGFVTTTRISHATPAALYAHSADRNWECNKNSSYGTIDSTDITAQFVYNEPGKNIKVALGGGRASFLPSDLTDEEKQEWGYSEEEWKDCIRKDNRNLINEYLNKSKLPGFEGARVKVVKDWGQLNNTNTAETDYLLGLFGWGFMKYEHQREKMANLTEREPSLAEMTEAAIKMLKKSENGFFLMVEGGMIDVAHHEAWANVALHETMAMDKAVEMALSLVDIADTLIIVTADHGHTMSMGGYQTRGADIRGVVDNSVGDDKKVLSILSYANGPGFYNHLYAENGNVSRMEINGTDFTSFDVRQPSSAPLKGETHSGSDVGIFAIGPFAHFFRSVHEQNYIAYVMAYSACIGPYENDCHSRLAASTTTTTTTTTTSSILLLMTVLWIFN